MYSEEELLPLSALQHLVYCERQCALIHIEQAWSENALTLEGSRLHRRTDEGGPRKELRGDLLILRGIPLRSFRLGLSGRADVVEFHRAIREPGSDSYDQNEEGSVSLPGITGHWRPFPVEYKRGKPKKDLSDKIQLCAQALCLEEMLAGSVPDGALFYGRNQRRTDVCFDTTLVEETKAVAKRLHDLIRSGVTPVARKEPKCDRCSLLDLCIPEAMGRGRSARAFFSESLHRSIEAGEDGE